MTEVTSVQPLNHESEKRGDSQEMSREIPEHYAVNPEPVKVIQAWGLNFCLGNVVKYVARAGRKAGNSKKQDIEKAIVYLQIELESLEKEE